MQVVLWSLFIDSNDLMIILSINQKLNSEKLTELINLLVLTSKS